ncbi:MAG: hypothetical protein ACO1OB_28480 [Archangium sp.]
MFTMLLGATDVVPGEGGQEDHKICTRFFAFVGPLVPFRTMCITREDFEHHGNASTHSYSGEDVKLSFVSIVLGYVRVWSWIMVLALPFILHWGENLTSASLVPSGYALGVAIAALVLPGLFTRGRVKRLTVERRITGLGCDPSRRYDWARNETLERLTAALAELSLPTSPDALLDRVSSLNADQAALIFTWAWYRGDEALREAAWQKCAHDSSPR